MTKLSAGLIALSLCVPAAAAAQPAPPAKGQIALAVHAAPPEQRAGAAVLGYDESGKLVELRAGSNELICLADDPKADGISVACYHKDLEPYMARGRELRAQGADGRTRAETRFKEIESGKLPMPKEGRTLYVTTGTAYDAATDTIAGAYTRWVIYLPFARRETTGLPTNPTGPGSPWLMDADTAGAHIMISPPRSK